MQKINWIILLAAVMGWPNSVHSTNLYSLGELDLQQMISVASDHDTVSIAEGTYQISPVLIEKPITILGIGKVNLQSKFGDELLVIMSDSVNILNLSLNGVKTSYLKERSAIRVVKSKDFLIHGNEINNCFFGIYLEKASQGTVSYNRIAGVATTEAASGNAIHAWYCKKIIITDNYLSGHRDGIYFEFVDQSVVKKNISENNKRYGLHFMFSNNDQYLENIFRKNGAGVAVMFSKEIKMNDNQFTLNWGNSSYGLLLKEINDAEVIDNDFDHNTIGIFVEGSNRIKYHGNDFRGNGWSIKFSGGCSANEISGNNFINNSLDLVVSTKLSDNVIINNYWSDYSGYDLNHDNVGDIPHYPVKLFSYILDQVPEAIILMRSFFVDIMNFSEKVSPLFTPKEVFDSKPLMYPVK